MNIIEVRIKDKEGYIPLPDLESLKGALTLFESGRTRSSRETERRGIGQVGGGMASVLMTLVGDKGGSRFLESLFKEMEASLSQHGRYHRSFDYDGPGVFHKTTVEAGKLPGKNAGYFLHLNAAYVADAPEAGLAETLQVERGLWRTNVEIELGQIGQQFEIDFDLLANRLHRFNPSAPTADEMAATVIAGRSQFEGSPCTRPGSIVIPSKDLSITLGVITYTVGNFYDYKTRTHSWIRHGNVIRGALTGSHERGSKSDNPVLLVTVSAPDEPAAKQFECNCVFDPKVKDHIRTTAAKIARALQSK